MAEHTYAGPRGCNGAEPQVRTTPTTQTALRCAFCHDTLDARAKTCSRCGTKLHRECGTDLERCPSLGCGDWAPLRTWGDELREARDWLFEWLAMGILLCLGVIAASVVVMAMVVRIHSTFTF